VKFTFVVSAGVLAPPLAAAFAVLPAAPVLPAAGVLTLPPDVAPAADVPELLALLLHADTTRLMPKITENAPDRARNRRQLGSVDPLRKDLPIGTP
jgi:hypothetical protein